MSLVVPQPAPVAATSPPVWPMVIADARRYLLDGPHLEAFVADMAERDRLGRERYGTPLQADNGRDHLVDAYQEALDLCVYLRAEAERTPMVLGDRGDYLTALSLAWRLRERLNARPR